MELTGARMNSPHIAESLHWYRPDGSPAYEVPAAKGGMRPTTLRDARKSGLLPSVTSIIKCAAAPGLERWKQDQILMAALTTTRQEGESESEWIARIKRDADEQARTARDRGTEIHAAIQGHFEGKAPSEEMWPHVKGVVAELEKHFGKREWVAERSFAHPMGFGGKVDLSGSAIIDFKGSDFDTPINLKTWPEHHMQLAAYREGLGLNGAPCGICYFSRSNPGLAKLLIVDGNDLNRGWEMFMGLFAYWKARSGYDPKEWKA